MVLSGLIQALQVATTERAQAEARYFRFLAEERDLKERLKQIERGRLMAAGALDSFGTMVERLQAEIEAARARENHGSNSAPEKL